ncbi:MAG: ArnT family glycosyltransferase [Planctomycetota bacterium]
MSEIETDSTTPSQQRSHRAVAITLLFFVLAAFAVRLTALALRQVVFYDETYYYILGRSLFSGSGYTLNGLPNTAFPPLYPLLVGFVSLFADGLGVSTSLVSALAGALLPLPVYFLARLFYGRRVSLVSSAFAAFWPALVFFAGRNVPYAERLYSGSEPLFVTLMTGGILFLVRAAREREAREAMLAGLFLGLATLTRNEGALLSLFIGAWFVITAFAMGPMSGRTVKALSALAAATFLAVVAPFVAYVYGQSGRVSMGSKVSNLVRTRPALWGWIEDDEAIRYICIHYSLNDEDTQMEDPYWGASDWHRRNRSDGSGIAASLALLGDPDVRWLEVLGRSFYEGAVPLVPVYAWPFLLAGLVRAFIRRKERWLPAIFAALLAAHAAQAVFVYTIARFELTLVVPIALFAASGACTLGRLISLFAKRAKARRATFAAALYTTPATVLLVLMFHTIIVSNLSGSVRQPGGSPFSARERDQSLAAALREEIPEGATLMCHEPWTAVWAGADWRVSPAATRERVVKYAHNRGIEYALLAEWQIVQTGPGTALYPYLVGKIGSAHYLYSFVKPPAEEEIEGGTDEVPAVGRDNT